MCQEYIDLKMQGKINMQFQFLLSLKKNLVSQFSNFLKFTISGPISFLQVLTLFSACRKKGRKRVKVIEQITYFFIRSCAPDVKSAGTYVPDSISADALRYNYFLFQVGSLPKARVMLLPPFQKCSHLHRKNKSKR